MASTIEQILEAIAPQFNTSTTKDVFIKLAKNQTSASCFGVNYNQAVALRTAHMMTLSSPERTGVAGSVSGKTESNLRISFGSSSQSANDDLSQTSYGLQLQALITATGLVIGVTGLNLFLCGG